MAGAFRTTREQNAHNKRRHDNKQTHTMHNTERKRMCDRFAANLYEVLELTDYSTQAWLPTSEVVNEQSEEAAQNWYSIASLKGSIKGDEWGYLGDEEEDRNRASNCIEVATVYGTAEVTDGDYLVRQSIPSPFSSENWGRLPLSLNNWRIIAPLYITSRVYWQWVPAVREYFKKQGDEREPDFLWTLGWSLGAPRKGFRPHDIAPEEVWTGTLIYSLAAASSFRTNIRSITLK